MVLDGAGTVFAVREVYRIEPPFNRLALSSQTELDASVTGSTIEGVTGVPAIEPFSRITAIDGKVVALTVTAPDGRAATHRIEASPRYLAQVGDPGPIKRDARLRYGWCFRC